jgi:hypothetical protein
MAKEIRNTSSQQQELCIALRKRFAIKQAIDIKQHLIIEPIAPNKIGVCFKEDLHLTKEQKDLLRESLRSVYGESVSIVSLSNIQATKTVVLPALPVTKAIPSTPSVSEPITRWQKVKVYLTEIYGQDLVEASCIQLDITEQGNKITFVGSDTFTEIIENKFGAILNRLAKTDNLHFVFKGKSKAFAKPIISEILSC